MSTLGRQTGHPAILDSEHKQPVRVGGRGRAARSMRVCHYETLETVVGS
jgi:hypothetical protein